MTVAVEQVAFTAISSNSTSHVMNMPSSVANGNLLIALGVIDGNPSLTAPAGWTTEQEWTASAPISKVLSRTASSEPASYTWTSGAAEKGMYCVLEISGWAALSTARDGSRQDTVTSWNSGNITTTEADCLAIWIALVHDAPKASENDTQLPTGGTFYARGADESNHAGLGVGWAIKAGAGAIGTKTWGAYAIGGQAVGYAAFVTPAAGAAEDFPALQRLNRGVGPINAARLGGVLQRSFERVGRFFLPDRRLIVAHGA